MRNQILLSKQLFSQGLITSTLIFPSKMPKSKHLPPLWEICLTLLGLQTRRPLCRVLLTQLQHEIQMPSPILLLLRILTFSLSNKLLLRLTKLLWHLYKEHRELHYRLLSIKRPPNALWLINNWTLCRAKLTASIIKSLRCNQLLLMSKLNKVLSQAAHPDSSMTKSFHSTLQRSNRLTRRSLHFRMRLLPVLQTPATPPLSVTVSISNW